MMDWSELILEHKVSSRSVPPRPKNSHLLSTLDLIEPPRGIRGTEEEMLRIKQRMDE